MAELLESCTEVRIEIGSILKQPSTNRQFRILRMTHHFIQFEEYVPTLNDYILNTNPLRTDEIIRGIKTKQLIPMETKTTIKPIDWPLDTVLKDPENMWWYFRGRKTAYVGTVIYDYYEMESVDKKADGSSVWVGHDIAHAKVHLQVVTKTEKILFGKA